MVLATRCPHCSTAFRVVPDQIKLRGGWVRCGVCNETFDSAEELIEVEADGTIRPVPVRAPAEAVDAAPDGAPSPPAQTEEQASEPREPAGAAAEPVVAAVSESESLSPQPDTVAPAADAVPGDAEPEDPPVVSEPLVLRRRGEGLVAPPAEDETPAAAPIVREPLAAEPAAAPPIAPEPPPSFLDEEAQGQRKRSRIGWTLLALAALLALLGQAAWIFRAELATRVPALRPAMESLCQRFGCTVGYPRAPELLVIESSSMEPWAQDAAPAEAAPAESNEIVLPVRRLALRVTLRNGADFPQDWPAIELSLMDLSDTVVSRRVLPPAAYLPPQARGKPIAPRSEQTLLVPIETIDAHATGYRVAIFHP